LISFGQDLSEIRKAGPIHSPSQISIRFVCVGLGDKLMFEYLLEISMCFFNSRLINGS